ncbi:MAG TPA: hypothetical protein VI248_16245 [Kineosporiaceae bacterium]
MTRSPRVSRAADDGASPEQPRPRRAAGTPVPVVRDLAPGPRREQPVRRHSAAL